MQHLKWEKNLVLFAHESAKSKCKHKVQTQSRIEESEQESERKSSRPTSGATLSSSNSRILRSMRSSEMTMIQSMTTNVTMAIWNLFVCSKWHNFSLNVSGICKARPFWYLVREILQPTNISFSVLCNTELLIVTKNVQLYLFAIFRLGSGGTVGVVFFDDSFQIIADLFEAFHSHLQRTIFVTDRKYKQKSASVDVRSWELDYLRQANKLVQWNSHVSSVGVTSCCHVRFDANCNQFSFIIHTLLTNFSKLLAILWLMSEILPLQPPNERSGI